MITATIINGNALDVLKTLPTESVHCVVTSPPYYGLRDYGTATWIGGDPACDHNTSKRKCVTERSKKQMTNNGSVLVLARGVCDMCGAIRSDAQVGVENGVNAYVEKMVEIFSEVWRVLRRDGVVFLNLGDSYNGSGGAGGDYGPGGLREGQPKYPGRIENGLKPKDLIGVPWRVAFALQAAGWWLRSDIIYAKRAPMPESVTDRPTRSHEYIFLLTKSARYFYDAEAVKETTTGQNGAAANFRRTTKDGGRTETGKAATQHRIDREPTTDNGSRNQRDVWHLSPEPYREAHFATYPTEIPRRAILAGTSERGCCPSCGAPWERRLERTKHSTRDMEKQRRDAAEKTGRSDGHIPGPSGMVDKTVTTGWQPTCTCFGHFETINYDKDWIADEIGVRRTRKIYIPDGFQPDPIPCTVLDPFLGSGTTVAVAVGLGRHGIGIELNADYCELARRRIEGVQRPLEMAL